MEAIEKRYGGNKESKKVQRTLLKQEYKIFVGSSSETMDQTLDRLQKLVSQLEIQGEVIAQEDMNLKLLRKNEEYNKSKSDRDIIFAFPPPYTWNFIPSKPDLMFMDEIVESENMDVITIVTPSNVKKVESNQKVEFIPNVKDKTVRPSTEKIKFVKSARETVEKVIRPVWNNSSRVNHKNFANKMTHPHPNRRFVPQAVLTRSGKINTAGASVNTVVRPINTAGSKLTMNHPRLISNAYKKGYLQVTKPFNKYSANKKSIFNKKVNTARVKDTTARDRAVGNPQQKEYKEKGVIDSGCSRHMTGNKCYLTEYEDYDGGIVPFGKLLHHYHYKW
ncbi:hypothetical protein Tco_0300379 [Tanacetum coccineum]